MLRFSFHSWGDWWLELTVLLPEKSNKSCICTFLLVKPIFFTNRLIEGTLIHSPIVFSIHSWFCPQTLWGIARLYFWWITCRVLFSGRKREDLYFILRLSLFTKLNASLPSICLTLPGHTGLSTKRIFLKICRNILTNVCPTWSTVAASTTLKSLTVNIWLASTNKFAPSLYHQA